MNLAAVGTAVAVLGLGGGFYTWDLNQRQAVYESLSAAQVAGDVELELARVNLELKLLRDIEERRQLTPDEEDRRTYLLALREKLLDWQRGRD